MIDVAVFCLMLIIAVSGIVFTFRYERRRDGPIEPETFANFDETEMETDFSQLAIQDILDKFTFNAIGSSEVEKYSFFTFTISQSENIYVQGTLSIEHKTLNLELVSPKFMTNPNILNQTKFKEIVLLGWEAPLDNENFSCQKSFQESFEGDTSKFIYDSLKIFNIPLQELKCSYLLA